MDGEALPLIEDEGMLEAIRDASNSIVTPDTMAFLMPDTYRDNRQFISAHAVVDEDVIPAGYLSTLGGATNFVPIRTQANQNTISMTWPRIRCTGGHLRIARPRLRASSPPICLTFTSATWVRCWRTWTRALTRIVWLRALSITSTTTPCQTKANNGEPAGKELAPYVVMVAGGKKRIERSR